ncbi:MAG: HTH domain-containing protein [Sedimentibacter sp.]|jgi:biotin operon repressor
MRFIDRKRKVMYLLELIEKGNCFSAEQASIKLGCSSRTVKRMIEDLREEGHEIMYCRHTNKYRIIL